jgi:glycosyltransferase involved in cell wall biosynthesis
MMPRRKRLLVVQPYVPAYRVALFEQLRQALAAREIDLHLAVGVTPPELEARRDSRGQGIADEQLAEWSIRLGGSTLRYRRLDSLLGRLQPDLVIVEQAIKNLELYGLLLRRSLHSSYRLGLWGHGLPHPRNQPAAKSRLRMAITRRADWFFAYTQAGADYVVQHGVRRDRVTVLNNTIDTAALGRELALVTERDLSEFNARLGLSPGITALFLGGVDQHKGVDFLVAAAGEIRRQLPGFVLLIGGRGGLEARVQAAQEAGAPIRFLGRLDDASKALALTSCSILCIPEWVGLVAVDSCVAGRPIVTTVHPNHAPEFEYLRDGENAILVPHEIGAYAAAVSDLLSDGRRLSALQAGAVASAEGMMIEAMVERFVAGIESWVRTT